MPSSKLSQADSKVLSQVFDPGSGPARAEVLVDPTLPSDRQISDSALLLELKSREKDAVRLIEQYENSSIKTSQAKETAYRSALEILDRIIDDQPSYASARNNRAQLRRWRYGDRNMLCRQITVGKGQSEAGSAALRDLEKAISLASPGRPQDPVSPSQGKLLAQAYTQLGALYLGTAKDLEVVEVESAKLEIDVGLADWTKDRFEEEASRAFYLGGLYGNEVAKALAVHTNPHAKLCGNIVKEAMRKEFAAVGAL